ncbi:protein translocase subunit SecF [Clostridium sp. 19966]|uniref:protein translocase subunit SecF n=1 Tax=Clostridium sp. 19966 TaxID=2768166 RepID=UPI0028DF2019|nr:protein translocase subunit SecF [Clostridium sp. 19966]MDT8717474.1 protein translocase subunit SecF [Clostridium sp. 19966]
MLKIIEKSKIWFGISLAIIIFGMIYLGVHKLNLGIDFTGGSTITIDMGKKFNKEDVEPTIQKYAPDEISNVVNTTQLEIDSNKLTQDKVTNMVKELKDKYKLPDKAIVNQSTISSSIGTELKVKAIEALAVATIIILGYIAFRFKDWRFGIAAVIALIHDVLITLSVYAIFQVPVNSPFIAAMLTITGYSICDTVVIFDRIRENQRTFRGKEIIDIADISITQSITRSMNTVFTVLTMLSAVYFIVDVPTIKEFTFPLIIGIFSGAYSSICIASPLWVLFKRVKKKKTAKLA